MGSLHLDQLGLAILMYTSPTGCLVHTDRKERATIGKDGHVSVIGHKPALAQDCSPQIGIEACLENGCGWGIQRMAFVCAPCASFASSTTCPSGCARIGTNTCQAVKDLVFGGTHHSDDKIWQYRPEAVQSLKCEQSKCAPCLSMDDCWHGAGSFPWNDLMTVNLAAGSSGSRKAIVWVRCLKTESSWITTLGRLSNGILTIKLNGKRKERWTPSNWHPFKELKSVVGQGDNILEFIFRAEKSSKDATVSIVIKIKDVQAWVDTCMARKLCLEKLGNGTNESFGLRNDNQKQLQCLQATSPEGICEEWAGCIDDTYKKTLVAILRVVGRKPAAGARAVARHPGTRDATLDSSMSRKETARATLVDQTSECIDPSTHDPEAAECECFSDIQESCGDKIDQEGCILEKVCANSNVCQTWRDNMCPASLGSATANVQGTGSLLMRRSQAEERNTAAGNTEDALQGKCTSETQ